MEGHAVFQGHPIVERCPKSSVIELAFARTSSFMGSSSVGVKTIPTQGFTPCDQPQPSVYDPIISATQPS